MNHSEILQTLTYKQIYHVGVAYDIKTSIYFINQQSSMKQYLVTVYEVHSYDVKIDAENSEQAKELVESSLIDEDLSNNIAYNYTMDSDKWPDPIEITK
jgi:hypothetical protein